MYLKFKDIYSHNFQFINHLRVKQTLFWLVKKNLKSSFSPQHWL